MISYLASDIRACSSTGVAHSADLSLLNRLIKWGSSHATDVPM